MSKKEEHAEMKAGFANAFKEQSEKNDEVMSIASVSVVVGFLEDIVWPALEKSNANYQDAIEASLNCAINFLSYRIADIAIRAEMSPSQALEIIQGVSAAIADVTVRRVIAVKKGGDMDSIAGDNIHNQAAEAAAKQAKELLKRVMH